MPLSGADTTTLIHTYNVDTQRMHTHTQGIHVLTIAKLAVSRAGLAAFPHLRAGPGRAVYQLARGSPWLRRASADEGSANAALSPRAGACFGRAGKAAVEQPERSWRPRDDRHHAQTFVQWLLLGRRKRLQLGRQPWGQ